MTQQAKNTSVANQVFASSPSRVRRASEYVSLTIYVCTILGVLPYAAASSRHYLLGNPWAAAGHLGGLLATCFVLLFGMHRACRFGPYWLWNSRLTFAVAFFCLYLATGWFAQPRNSLLRTSAWFVCIVTQSILLACAQFLEAWFRGQTGLRGPIQSRELANQVCWNLFTASWTGVGAVLLLAGITIGFAGARRTQSSPATQRDEFALVVLYLAFTLFAVFMWIMRPCFEKSVRIISQLDSDADINDLNA